MIEKEKEVDKKRCEGFRFDFDFDSGLGFSSSLNSS